MLPCLILIDALSSACWEKKGKRERERERERERKEKQWGAFFFYQCLDMSCWLGCAGFLRLLGAIKG
jgi:hypothetical protein